MPEGTRAGFPTHWISHGDGPRDALFLHCSLASSRSLMPLMDRVGDHLSITAPDLPGHGGSGAWDGQGDYVARATDMAEAFCDGPRDLVGHSLGAVVALSLMVRRPDLVRSATLIEPVFFAAARGRGGYGTYISDHAPIMDDIEGGHHEAATRAFTDIWGAPRSWDDTRQSMRRAMIDRIPLIAATAPALEGDSNDLLSDGRLEAVDAPVLLVRGEQSHPVIPDILSALADRLPDTAIEVVAGANHMAPITHPDEVARLIDRQIRPRND
ncbi:alpha/beta fold hydrolase [Palleronia abyssalis]|uniref:2-(Acetamidomethylene)succinate hydrolase n=1 Tax=Palleronia abyssalis TaxID=1501240 RepID=A0A2R8C0G1_9RHOB|nr:alpha/beta hydrolase [Palleronia abyssalis]SPJ25863.1 2-(acetamidomethylene)succinate hydrolase [Palleronia abyssalis]